jgi:succinate---hydroxymethylglutarate CoA-transferase
MSNSYQSKDGRWLYMIARDWPELCRVLHLEALEKDSRFSEQMPRTKNRKELIKILEEAFAEKTRDEWIAHFKASQAVNLFYEVVNTIPDLANDEQILANNLILEENHRGLGPIKMLKFPFNFSKTPVSSARNAAPSLGEHSQEVLEEYGYSPEEIAQLRKEKVI